MVLRSQVFPFVKDLKDTLDDLTSSEAELLEALRHVRSIVDDYISSMKGSRDG